MYVVAQVGALFTVPSLAAAGAAAVSVPVLIHLLWRLRRRPEVWGAMRFLQQAYRRQRSRLRMEQLLLLMVRCLIVLVLGLALAGPLLSGCVGRWAGGLEAGGRDVVLVIDDALPARATAPTGEPRIERLRRTAHRLVDALRPADRVALWRAGRPATPIIASPTQDRAAVREALDNLQPRHSRPDMPTALQQVAEMLRQRPGAPDRASVVLLSDFSGASAYLDDPPADLLRTLGERATLWALRPATGVGNVQIEALQPRRRMVLAEGPNGTVTVPVELRLRRFEGTLPEARVGVELAVLDAQGEALSVVQREQRFVAGQGVATLNVSVPVEAGAAALNGGGQVLVVRARLDPGSMTNRLTDDDTRYALVELRRYLAVGVIDEPTGLGEADRERGRADLSPAQWLVLALAPQEALDRGPVRPELIAPTDVAERTLTGLDAALVLRPDRLSEASWRALAQLGQRGGMVWVFTPPLETPAIWSQPMQRALGLDWRLGLDPVVSDSALGLQTDVPTPEPLRLLAADWEALLRPVRVMRRLPLVVPDAQQWLAVSADDESEGATVLAATELDQGMVLLLATALDADWTNLPTKPLFVPLVHETLRGVLGAARGRLPEPAVAGDVPALDAAWRGAQALRRVILPGGGGGDADGEASAVVALGAQPDGGLRPAAPLTLPGVYAPTAESEGRRMVVNVDADAGDTLAVSEQRLARWLDGLGEWQFVDEGQPAAVFAQAAETVSLGWPLLWVVLALVLLETVLARYLSHAKQENQRTIARRMVDTYRYLRHGPAEPGPNGNGNGKAGARSTTTAGSGRAA